MAKQGAYRKLDHQMKHQVNKMKSGVYVGRPMSEVKDSSPVMLRVFGCLRCSWIGSDFCPHGKKIGEHHANWICKERALYIKSEFLRVGTVPKLIQQEKIVELKFLTERMLAEYGETGELHEEYKHLVKILGGYLEKMRRQDEGIKIAEEVTVTHQDFRKLVDIQAEKIEEQNRREGQDKPEEETGHS